MVSTGQTPAFSKLTIESDVEHDVRRIVQTQLKGGYEHGELETELMITLLPHGFEWLEFDEWHRYFSEQGYFPNMWSGLEYEPQDLSSEFREYLRSLRALSMPARRLLWNCGFIQATGPKTLKMYDLKRRSRIAPNRFEQVLDELRETWLEHPVSMDQRLHLLRVADLKPILQEYDLPVSGRKADLVDRIVGNVSDSEISKHLTSDALQDLVANKRWLPPHDREAFRYLDNKIGLLAHTASSMGYAQSRLDEAVGHVKRLAIPKSHDEHCSVCSRLTDTEIGLAEGIEDRLPPFHPGCRCFIQPVYQFEREIHLKPQTKRSGCAGQVLLLFMMLGALAYIILMREKAEIAKKAWESETTCPTGRTSSTTATIWTSCEITSLMSR